MNLQIYSTPFARKVASWAILSLLIFGISAPILCAQTVVTFPDATLERELRLLLDIPVPSPIYDTDLATVTVLRIGDSDLSDLTGIEYCINLQELSVGGNRIEDISPLSGLTNLLEVSLRGNPINDFSPLATLTRLTFLSFDSDSLSNLSFLGNLSNLNFLSFSGILISDIGPLANLAELNFLSISNTAVSDVGPLSALSKIDHLSLNGCPVSDIAPLSSLTNLDILSLQGTQVSDIGPLVENAINGGLGPGDSLVLFHTPLSCESIDVHIPWLYRKGINVYHHAVSCLATPTPTGTPLPTALPTPPPTDCVRRVVYSTTADGSGSCSVHIAGIDPLNPPLLTVWWRYPGSDRWYQSHAVLTGDTIMHESYPGTQVLFVFGIPCDSLGDINKDGHIDSEDLFLLQEHWHKKH